MLPDIPKLKADLAKVQWNFVFVVQRENMRAFSDSPTHYLYEGDQSGISREGEEEETDPLYKVSGELTTQPHIEDLASTFSKLHAMGCSMAEQNIKQTFQYLDKRLPKSQTVEGRGRGITPEVILEVLETIKIPLNDKGELDLGNFKLASQTGNAMSFSDLIKSLNMTVAESKKLQSLLDKMKEEQVAREANRELVG